MKQPADTRCLDGRFKSLIQVEQGKLGGSSSD
jgi:hypothetical protein